MTKRALVAVFVALALAAGGVGLWWIRSGAPPAEQALTIAVAPPAPGP